MNTMAKSKGQKGAGANTSQQGLMTSLFQASMYKPLQGRIVRQVTFVSVAIIALLIAFEMSGISMITDLFSGASFAFGLVFSVIGLWIAYRSVNHPPFADFLIAVEAEMNKVSWPTWPELWKASLVVIFVIFAMSLSLWVFDLVWAYLFWLIGIR
jgi:preprotein translocase subunit SecE